MDSTYYVQNIYFISVNNTVDEYKIELFKRRISLIKTLLGAESVNTLDSSECNYIDIDYSDTKQLKKNFLWKK